MFICLFIYVYAFKVWQFSMWHTQYFNEAIIDHFNYFFAIISVPFYLF